MTRHQSTSSMMAVEFNYAKRKNWWNPRQNGSHNCVSNSTISIIQFIVTVKILLFYISSLFLHFSENMPVSPDRVLTDTVISACTILLTILITFKFALSLLLLSFASTYHKRALRLHIASLYFCVSWSASLINSNISCASAFRVVVCYGSVNEFFIRPSENLFSFFSFILVSHTHMRSKKKLFSTLFQFTFRVSILVLARSR